MLTSGRIVGLSLLALFTVIGILSIALLSPPVAVPADAPANVFSAQRAIAYLRHIAARPHPMGSAELTTVRAYLLRELTNLGYAPVVQTATVENATVSNVLVRVPGSGGHHQAVLFDAHYDSCRRGPGAGDNGVAVAAMLETLRALRAGAPLRNDVMVVFSDGEEAGLLGTQAALRHPWMRDVKVVFNFDARGVNGPVMMFETSRQNRWLIREFACAVPYPLANSVSDAIYQVMPNRTNFTVYSEAGYPGLNFAFIDGSQYYHTPDDNLRHVDPRTVQRVGSCLLGLARHFGDCDLTQASRQRGDAIYGNVLGGVFIYYPKYLVLPLLIGAALLAGVILGIGLWRKVVSLPGLLLGMVYMLLLLVIASAVTLGIQHLSANLTRQFVASLLISTALSLLVYRLVRLRVAMLEMTAGIALWWLVLALVAGVVLPAGSHLFFWPALLGWCGVGAAVLTQGKCHKAIPPLFLSPAGLVGILFWCPMLYLMFIALPDIFPGLVAMAMMVFGLLLCSLDALAASRKAA